MTIPPAFYRFALLAPTMLLLAGTPGERTAMAQSPASDSPAVTFDSTFFQAYEWRNIGPKRGGRSLDIEGVASQPGVYYFGATGGGLWKTTDGGVTWNPVTDGQLGSSSVGAVAVADSDPDVIYIGMGEVCLRGSITQGDGVYKSEDGGETWEHVGLGETQAIGRIEVHPEDPELVYVAALGHPYGDNQERGVFRSTDGGETWEKVLYVSEKAGAPDLVMDKENPGVLYASTWQVYRKSWKMWGGGPDSGLWKTTDGGDTWTELTQNEGMPAGPIGRIGVDVSPVDPSRVWAVVEAHEGGVFRSDDGGQTWERTNTTRKIRQRSFYYSHIYADPHDRDAVYALNTDLYKSTDGGETFDINLEGTHGDFHDLWLSPDDPNLIATANDGGGAISTNMGETWTEQDFVTAQLYNLTLTNDFPYHACSGQQDNSTVCVPSGGWDHVQARGPDSDWYYSAGGGESGWVTQNPQDHNIFYSGSQGALLTRYSRASGQIRDIQVYPRFFSGEPASALPERWQWTFPIVFSKRDSSTMYTTSQHVWRTTNDGQSWERISPDLTLADPKTLGVTGGLITMDMNGPEIYATVFALEPSHHSEQTIWAGSDDGKLHLTRNSGESWDDITPPDMPRYTRVSVIDESPHSPGTVYVAGNRYQVDDRQPYVWKTDDYGETWEKITDGIESDHFARSVREDPEREGLLYLATEHQVYVSFDDGAQWQDLQLNMPDTPVRGLSTTENDVVVATHGRGYWVLDDVNPMRAYQPEVASDGLTLFQPPEVVRMLQGRSSASVYYYLSEQADSVQVDLLDGQGETIRSITGTEPELEEPEEPSPWGPDSLVPPTTKQGLNRFVWDLEYPGAAVFEGLINWSADPEDGPIAPPGSYQVRITALGETQAAPFEVTMDPRTEGVTDADLQEQFELAMQIRDQTTRANEAVIQTRQVRTALADRLESIDEADLEEQAQEVADALYSIEQDLYQVRNESGQDPLNFPIKLNNRLASLRRSVEDGVGPPTDNAYEVYEQLSEELEGHLAHLETIMSEDLPPLNERLEANELSPVEPDHVPAARSSGE